MMRNIRTIFWAFTGTALGITILHFLYHPVRVLGMDTSIFYMDEKVTLSAYFTTATCFLIGVLTLITFRVKTTKLDRILRLGMGLFFLFLSIDEYLEIHEYVSTVLKGVVNQNTITGGLVYYSWIVPFALLILFVYGSLVLTTLREEKAHRKFLWAGLLCYAGILIAEFVGGSTYGQPVYLIFVGIEEGLEMISAALFLRYALASGNYFP